jgi:hypothetical protein
MYFTPNVIDPLAKHCYPDGRPYQQQFTLHFDNALIQNTNHVLKQMEACDFSRMDRPVCSTDLAPCDFFLFGYLKENLASQSSDVDEVLFSGVRTFLAVISGDLVVSVLGK